MLRGAAWSASRDAGARPRPGGGRRCRASASGRSCYRLAGELGLAGFVLNDERGVLVEVEGAPAPSTRFLRAAAAPRRRRWRRIERGAPSDGRAAPASAGSRSSRARAAASPTRRVSPDTATCDDCLPSCSTPRDRRYRYPFINCTNCGPRFTIVRGVPYDRPLTTMAGFAHVRRAAAAEYDDPADRRFHAQPNACPECGPRVRLRGDAARRRGAARRPRRRCSTARSWRSRASAATTSPAAPTTSRRWRRCGAQAPRGQAVRADGARRRGGARRWSSWTGEEAALLRRARAADRARAAAAGRAGGGVGRAALAPTSA